MPAQFYSMGTGADEKKPNLIVEAGVAHLPEYRLFANAAMENVMVGRHLRARVLGAVLDRATMHREAAIRRRTRSLWSMSVSHATHAPQEPGLWRPTPTGDCASAHRSRAAGAGRAGRRMNATETALRGLLEQIRKTGSRSCSSSTM
jgi:hypothetical protein